MTPRTRTHVLRALLAALVALTLSSPALAAQARSADEPTELQSTERAIVARVNEVRRDRGLRPLRIVADLEAPASSHARSMAVRGYFSHESADGTSPFERIRRAYGGTYHGETLFWSSPGASAERTVSAWLASPPHRAILLSSSFRDVGVAAVGVDQGVGMYPGGPVEIVVADFGAR